MAIILHTSLFMNLSLAIDCPLKHEGKGEIRRDMGSDIKSPQKKTKVRQSY